ncbi:MAG: hypothetical protein JWP61_2674 [Friedmanniella sp.]|nr:hypothetical protein [Friedmanniella sp.]
MDLAVIHNIHDPEGWQAALAGDHQYPPGFNLRSFVQGDDGKRAVCLWEAPSQEALQENLDRIFGQAVVNDVFPVHVDFFEGRVDFS